MPCALPIRQNRKNKEERKMATTKQQQYQVSLTMWKFFPFLEQKIVLKGCWMKSWANTSKMNEIENHWKGLKICYKRLLIIIF